MFMIYPVATNKQTVYIKQKDQWAGIFASKGCPIQVSETLS